MGVVVNQTGTPEAAMGGFTADPGFAVTGTLADGQVIRITGPGGFGSRANVKTKYWIPLETNLLPHPTLSRITTSLGPDSTSVIQTAIKPVNAVGAGRVRACTTFLSGAPAPIIFQNPFLISTNKIYCFVKRYRSSAGNRPLSVDPNNQSGPLESKAFRIWSPGTTAPDTFNGQGPTGGSSFTEGVSDPVVTVSGSQVSVFHNQVEAYDVWVPYEHLMQCSSNVSTNDGIWNCARRGLLYHQFLSRWKTASPAVQKEGYFDEYSNCPRESLDYFHSMYIDDDPHRIFVSTESSFGTPNTIASGGALIDREICIPTAWLDNDVSGVLRQGSFSTLMGKYLYIGTDLYTATRIGQFT